MLHVLSILSWFVFRNLSAREFVTSAGDALPFFKIIVLTRSLTPVVCVPLFNLMSPLVHEIKSSKPDARVLILKMNPLLTTYDNSFAKSH